MNPFTQLIGISLVVHLSILLMSKGKGRAAPRTRPLTRFERNMRKVASLCILGMICSIALFSAGLIIFASIADPHSNLHLVQNLLNTAHSNMHILATGQRTPFDLFFATAPLPLVAATRVIQRMGRRS